MEETNKISEMENIVETNEFLINFIKELPLEAKLKLKVTLLHEQTSANLNMPNIIGVYSNKGNRTTSIKFEDGRIVSVTCDEEDMFDIEKGIAMALAKAAFGSKVLQFCLSNYEKHSTRALSKEAKEKRKVKAMVKKAKAEAVEKAEESKKKTKKRTKKASTGTKKKTKKPNPKLKKALEEFGRDLEEVNLSDSKAIKVLEKVVIE